MANEAVKVELTNQDGFQRTFTCASDAAITKGTLLKFSGDRLAAKSDADLDPIAGIAAMSKQADDYSTKISVWTNGILVE